MPFTKMSSKIKDIGENPVTCFCSLALWILTSMSLLSVVLLGLRVLGSSTIVSCSVTQSRSDPPLCLTAGSSFKQ